MSIEAVLNQHRMQVETALDRLMPSKETVPEVVHAAMRYSLFAGGKRLRPVLAALAFDAAGGTGTGIDAIACALEMVHTYSLIHDDLPVMDDDDLRRGKPTCHKVFGEAIAVLAGDGLLTRAFQVLSEEIEDAEVSCRVIMELASAAGTEGMVGGQVLDLASEGAPPDLEAAMVVGKMKTAALIRASLVMGAVAGGGSPYLLERLGIYGEKVGIAFQVVDDILDRQSTAEELGKTPGKDLKSIKMTFPSVLGMAGARELASKLSTEAKLALTECKGCELLRDLADYFLLRRA